MPAVNINPEDSRARQIDRDNFNRALGAIQSISRLTFDRHHFQISWHGPIPIVRLRRNALSGGGISMPFDCTLATATTVNVAAGLCYIAGNRRSVTAATGLDCSTGTSTTGYIYVNCNIATTLAGAITYTHTTEPANDDDEEKLILATVTKNASGKITGITQRWHGDYRITRA